MQRKAAAYLEICPPIVIQSLAERCYATALAIIFSNTLGLPGRSPGSKLSLEVVLSW